MGSFLSTLSGISSAVSPILGAGASLLGSHKAQKASYDAIDRQNSFNEYMYKKYKNPVNASKLLLQAGINPAFAYGNIAGNMGSTPEQTAPADVALYVRCRSIQALLQLEHYEPEFPCLR